MLRIISQIFSQESQIIADYENINLVTRGKAGKFENPVFSTVDFPQISRTKLSF